MWRNWKAIKHILVLICVIKCLAVSCCWWLWIADGFGYICISSEPGDIPWSITAWPAPQPWGISASTVQHMRLKLDFERRRWFRWFLLSTVTFIEQDKNRYWATITDIIHMQRYRSCADEKMLSLRFLSFILWDLTHFLGRGWKWGMSWILWHIASYCFMSWQDMSCMYMSC